METAIKGGYWQDITQEFWGSVKQLELGELLKTDQFTLLEAMSAIELMDPRTDSGMMLKKSDRKILNLEQSVRMGLVKIDQLELSELIGVIDDTYSCLATWLEGHSLAQTVMTNLYLHEPERIEDRCLRVFSLAILKLVDFMDCLVQFVFTIEEEDFVLNVGKFNLANQVTDQKVMSSLEELCKYYEKLLVDSRSRTSISGTKKQQQETEVDQVDDGERCNLDETQLDALIQRLRFTYNFYACFWNICRSLLKSHWDSQFTDAQLAKTTKLIHQSVLVIDQNLEECLKYQEEWSKTTDMGIKPNLEESTPSDGDYPTIMGFDPLINLKLLPPAYPRCQPVKSRPFTVDYLRDLIVKMRYCITISHNFNQKSLNRSMELIENFSKYFRPNSCVISRSFLQTLYLPLRSTKLLKDELLQSMTDYCEPLITFMKKDEGRNSILAEFLDESYKAFLAAISMYGHNTARQHEKFSELILSFKNLQYSGVVINSACNSAVLYSWATFHLARLCIKCVLSGLELELFSAHEYPYVFWYLYDILYRNEREQLEIAKQFIYESQLVVEETGKKNKVKKQRKKNQCTTVFHDKCLLSNDAFRFLTGGMFLLTYGLRLQGKIKTPSIEFTNEEICFDHRFSALGGTSVYSSYKQTLTRLEKLEYIYREALECFTEAKELFVALGDHESCLKVCKSNMVVAKILSSNLDSFIDREVEFCFDTHPSFPTIKV